jgi:TonB family protein
MKSAILFAICLAAAITAASAQEIPPYKPGGVVMPPRVAREVKPAYTADAIRARIEGVVRMEVVVNADGTVGDVRVAKSLDPLLDLEAVKAMKQWMFKPGTRNGEAVPVLVEVEMSFTLRDGPRLDSPDVFKPGDGVSEPRVISEVRPDYTPETKAKGIEGIVTLDCVVLTSGRVGQVRVTKPLEPALDDAAIRALRQWRFVPGTKDGKPVPVQVSVEIAFTLR